MGFLQRQLLFQKIATFPGGSKQLQTKTHHQTDYPTASCARKKRFLYTTLNFIF
jgi:hypothetical protein